MILIFVRADDLVSMQHLTKSFESFQSRLESIKLVEDVYSQATLVVYYPSHFLRQLI